MTRRRDILMSGPRGLALVVALEPQTGAREPAEGGP